MNSFADIIDLWPSAVELARDIGVSPGNVRAMKRLDSISAKYFVAIVAAAHYRGYEAVSYELMARLAAREGAGAFHGIENAAAKLPGQSETETQIP